MKKVNLEGLGQEINAIVPSEQNERIVLTRHGKPVAVVTALENLDEEDLNYISSPDFWKMIAARRSEPRLSMLEVKTRLEARERQSSR